MSSADIVTAGLARVTSPRMIRRPGHSLGELDHVPRENCKGKLTHEDLDVITMGSIPEEGHSMVTAARPEASEAVDAHLRGMHDSAPENRMAHWSGAFKKLQNFDAHKDSLHYSIAIAKLIANIGHLDEMPSSDILKSLFKGEHESRKRFYNQFLTVKTHMELTKLSSPLDSERYFKNMITAAEYAGTDQRHMLFSVLNVPLYNLSQRGENSQFTAIANSAAKLSEDNYLDELIMMNSPAPAKLQNYSHNSLVRYWMGSPTDDEVTERIVDLNALQSSAVE